MHAQRALNASSTHQHAASRKNNNSTETVMKKKTLARLSGICLAVAAATASLMAGNVQAAPGDTVKIGYITDLSGLYADIDGPGGLEAIRMAIADFGGKVNGKPIELVYAGSPEQGGYCGIAGA